ncbi:MAG: DinB family protein [Dehalococcoidia bacterium]
MGAFTYPRSEPGSAGHLDLVEALNVFMPLLAAEIDGLSNEVAAKRPAEGDWSINEVVGHLGDHARFLRERIDRMIKLEEPRLASWDQDEQWRERSPQDVDLQQLFREFSEHRTATVEQLSELVHWNWARQARHETLGRVSIRQLVERAIAHDENHLEQIKALRAV